MPTYLLQTVCRSVTLSGFGKKPIRRLFGNRGVNGIDGTLGTAWAWPKRLRYEVLLTGELAFLHLNALLFANQFRNNYFRRQ